MKKTALISVLAVLCIAITAQVPQSFNYQAVIRNAAGQPVVTQNISLFFTILKTSPAGTNVYSEKHNLATNEFGLVALAIGSGTEKTGDFSAIDWGNDNYYLNVKIDPAAGTNYTDMGTTQMLSVPYALVAEEVLSVSGAFYFRDKDGDGSGYMYESVWVPEGTAPPAHYVTNSDDCNDNDIFTQAGSAEICDGADNDCDGIIDEGYRDGNSIYNTNVACGNCYTDCQSIYDLPNASGICNSTGPLPVCVMVCDPGYYDLDQIPQNGCEFHPDADAIYVSPDGNNTAGCGKIIGGQPCQSINNGMIEAINQGKHKVLVANGIYNEFVEIHPGISLFGGYDPFTWNRNIESSYTVISGTTTIGPHLATVVANNITTLTTVSGFKIQGAINNNASGNSYAVYITSSNGNLKFTDNTINGGNAGDGNSGLNGSDGQDGSPGNTGTNTVETTSYTTNFNVSGGSGGTGIINGGNGGGVHGVLNGIVQQESGVNGSPGDGIPGGTGGAGGYNRTSSNCSTFNTGGYSAEGASGNNGLTGYDGTGGTGGTNPVGTVTSSHWKGQDGLKGQNGGTGSGGGGGGSGGGADVTINCTGTDDCSGGTGGGGGGGAAGGTGGNGGISGGSSFCIFMINSSTPFIENNKLFLGIGGDGGNGGFGGAKGSGGTGGTGGQISGPWAYVLGSGGNGGRGGDGGNGGGGGGGTGGSSFGIYTYNTTPTPDYESSNIFSGGNAGTGGSGGYSYGNAGQNGLNGVVQSCSYH